MDRCLSGLERLLLLNPWVKDGEIGTNHLTLRDSGRIRTPDVWTREVPGSPSSTSFEETETRTPSETVKVETGRRVRVSLEPV